VEATALAAYFAGREKPANALVLGFAAVRLEAARRGIEMDGYLGTPVDQADVERQWPQLKAQLLIDRGGIIRWANFECAKGMAELGKMPSDEEILAAARALRR